MINKTIYLDTFALTGISTDPALLAATVKYIHANSYVLIVGIMNLMELYTWPKRWPEVSDFISSVPFCIAENPEKILALEVEQYPDVINLPVAFCSSEHSFSKTEIKEAIEINLKTKVALFEKKYRGQYQDILEEILSDRKRYRPSENGKYSVAQRFTFMQINVLKFLFPDYQSFVEEQRAKSQIVKIESLKTAYIQTLIIFLEYYIQKKDGKSSDIGDIYQLAILPYVDLAVIDNERNDLFQRINQGNLFPEKLNTCNLAQFRKIIAL
jgi:hypothetical protein